MSIYPVRLVEWYPPSDENFDSCYTTVILSRCHACGKKLRYFSAIGHHSIPWGFGDVFCSWKCCYSSKEAKPDSRRERRMKRKYSSLEEKFIDILLKK